MVHPQAYRDPASPLRLTHALVGGGVGQLPLRLVRVRVRVRIGVRVRVRVRVRVGFRVLCG